MVMKLFKQGLRRSAKTIEEGSFETPCLKSFEKVDPVGFLARFTDKEGNEPCAKIVSNPCSSSIWNISYGFSLLQAAG